MVKRLPYMPRLYWYSRKAGFPAIPAAIRCSRFLFGFSLPSRTARDCLLNVRLIEWCLGDRTDRKA